MSLVILKYDVEPGINEVLIPGLVAVTVFDYQRHSVGPFDTPTFRVWALCDTTLPASIERFRVVGTGEEIEDRSEDILSVHTKVVHGAHMPLVLHLLHLR